MPMNFDAIIIGTGFGGTIAATKLAAKGKKVMMLERGTFWVTPEKLGQPPAGAKKPIPVWAKEHDHPAVLLAVKKSRGFEKSSDEQNGETIREIGDRQDCSICVSST